MNTFAGNNIVEYGILLSEKRKCENIPLYIK
jgi:hypothetical protein